MTTVQIAVARVPKDSLIVAPVIPGAPIEVLREICRQLPNLGRVTLMVGDASGRYDFLKEIPQGYEGNLKLLVASGALPRPERLNGIECEWLPQSFFELSDLIARGNWRIGACIVTGRLTGPREGRISPSLGYLNIAAAQADRVIFCTSSSYPVLYGDNRIQLSSDDVIVEIEEGIPETERRPLAPEQRCIGKYLASLISDGTCLQFGVGQVAEAFLNALSGHKDLSLNSGFVGPGLPELVRSGVMTGVGNRRAPGRLTVTGILGDRSTVAFCDGNPMLELRDPLYINSAEAVLSYEKFAAVNSALEVDIFGQVNAEVMGGKLRNSGAGQIDFLRNAHVHPQGKAIVALAATSSDGKHSRIVGKFDAGTLVTGHRNDTDFVVTEYGIADLRGVGLRQRMERLTAIAAPQFREDLARTAHMIV